MNSGLVELQQRAQASLNKNFQPPARYGTAFHITPPWDDVRKIELEGEQENDLKAWEELVEEDKKRVLAINLKDPYLAWHLASTSPPPSPWKGEGIEDSPPLLTKERSTEGRVRLSTRVLRLQANTSHSLRFETTFNSSELFFIILDPGSQLTIEDTLHSTDLALRRLFIWQKVGSELVYWGVRAENTFLNERVQVELVGHEASAAVTHLTLGRDKQQSDIDVAVYHKAPNTNSRMTARSAAADKHLAMYRGLIDVDQVARGTQAYQQGNSLLLSRQAVVDALPKLEIRTNDVRASHGVNVSHLDELTLFYIRSRGVSEAVARQLAMTGFFHHQLAIPERITHSLETAVSSFL